MPFSVRFVLSVSLSVLVAACGGPPAPGGGEDDAGTGQPPIQFETCLDNDGDGVPGTGECKGVAVLDCDDANPMRFPGASELCNGIDDDCDGDVDEGLEEYPYYFDRDGDGFGDAPTGERSCLPPPSGKVLQDGDCDDANAQRNPDVAEICNEIDDDCDGVEDNGLAVKAYYRDEDFDGAGDPDSTPITSCMNSMQGYVANADDCDDKNPMIRPGATELCNGVDDNCNGQIDDGLTFTSFYRDMDGDGYGDPTSAPISSCSPIPGMSSNANDCNDANPTVKPGAPEVCNGIDDDCDGAIDEGLTFANYYPDRDGDGFGAAGSTPVSACTQPDGHRPSATDCNDDNPTIKPGAPETCNDVDDNCNGMKDEGLATTDYWVDVDGDTYGTGSVVKSCRVLAGHATRAGDCKDNDPTVHPAATERCNGLDDNCNSQIDEGLTFTNYYPDSDGDGFGAKTAPAVSACSPVAGHVTNKTDCDDTRSSVHPGATEVCNSRDDDCDDLIDEGAVTQNWWPDVDQDGYGKKGAAPESSCAQPVGKVSNDGDCNDNNAAIRPNATEVCNGIDDNCNSQIDEGLATTAYYLDADLDGFGAGTAQMSCGPSSGRVTNNLDCDDTRNTVFPGATETCNNRDDDCDGSIDEGNPGGGATCSTGQSGVCAAGTQTCLAGALSCKRNVEPSAEACNGLDDDCDGTPDDGFSNLGQTCAAGLGVCRKTGTYQCSANGSGTECSATPGPPGAPACNSLDDDCDGIVDEPDFVTTSDIHPVAWQDIEVVPFYFTDAGCAGGVASGTDTLRGGAAVFAADSLDFLPDGGLGTAGSSAFLFQSLDTNGLSDAGVKSFSLAYRDIAIAQAGDAFVVAGIWRSKPEIDLHLIEPNGTRRAFDYSEYKPPDQNTDTLDSLRVVRGSGRSVVLVWREVSRNTSGAILSVKLKTARVTPPLTTGAWTIGAAVTLATGNNIAPGVGAASNYIDWSLSQTCRTSATQTIVTIAYRTDANTLKWFSIYDDISDPANKSADALVDFIDASTPIAEPEVVYYRVGTTSHWFVAYTISYSGGGEDLAYVMTTSSTYGYAWSAVQTGNGRDSIRRPRASVNSAGTEILLSALRFESSGSLQTMTRRILESDGGVLPAGPDVEISPTRLSCDGGDCRPGQKGGLTTWGRPKRVFYSGSGATPSGTWSSTLTCQ